MNFTLTRAILPHDTAERARAATRLGRLPEWDLSDLYAAPDAPELKGDLAALAADAKDFEIAYKGTLATTLAGADGGVRLGEALARYEAIEDRMGKVGSYAGLLYATDTTNPAYAKAYGDLSDKLTSLASHLLFFPLELNRVDDAVMDAALADPAAAHYKPWIEDLRKERPYQLADDIERLFLDKSASSRVGWSRLFDDTIAAIRVPLGAGDPVTLEEALNKLLSSEEATRKRASDGIAAALKANERTFTLITNTLAKDKEVSDRWRGFDDVAASRHLANRVEGEVVDALVSAVREAYPRLSHRYYRMKARWFGKPALDTWDRNAPLPEADDRTIPWTKAKETVLEAYGGFSPKLAELAARFFDNPWIDAPVRPGKAPGAFAHPTVPSAHPYVLLNYQGRSRDVMTLAHELGHGVHQILAGPNGALMAPTPLTLAETASVFGEMLTFRRLLEAAPDAQTRRMMLASKVEDMLNTVVRQIAFYTFERHVHTERREGELTSERLGEIWMEVSRESLGPSVRLGEGYEVFWSYIPHFINAPFYVYAYAFGDCLVNSLYGVYEKNPDGFAENYFALLAAGGTKHHSELLAPFGLDAREPAFWQTGLSLISGLIDELEAADAVA
ncbi:M3 family oligoendopeptidase [Acuticoccus mangrovi]|uniref:M3 family oligoendopeptidase n=1 Tax=Acuticoccus mangrovi TaxID=2796142 RepID=A0A934IQM6_9HYPH|nr:M3 family oligoendopeptidase [Acuticoccus mangrovi]MBJ3776828.1 M3 family oligoendopeptidase [Acuticoccus mangrovi]